MKSVSLADQIRKSAQVHRDPHKGGLYFPPGTRLSRTWPVCLTCGKDVDSANLEDVSSKGCELKVTCHGKEDSLRITWDCRMTDNSKSPLEDQNVGWCVKRAMADSTFFDPYHLENHASKH